MFFAKLFTLSRLLFLAISLSGISQLAIAAGGNLPQKILRPDHVVIVVEENRSFKQIIGNMATPYINTLAKTGALFTQSFGITHPSQPNYLALFSGTTFGAVDDRCPLTLSGDNLASELMRQGLTFAIYSESMPSPGYTGCQVGHYVRKHNPAANWQSLGGSADINLPFTRFPADFSKLPTVSMVVPNQQNDMHNDPPLEAMIRGDKWLRDNLDSYLRWAATHNSLLILTFDEDDGSGNNHIATVFAGPMVKRGIYETRITHYNVLRTIIDIYNLRPIGETINATPVTDIWLQ